MTSVPASARRTREHKRAKRFSTKPAPGGRPQIRVNEAFPWAASKDRAGSNAGVGCVRRGQAEFFIAAGRVEAVLTLVADPHEPVRPVSRSS
jgi:hypothetical protein